MAGPLGDVAIVREIQEELGLTASFRLLWSTDDHRDWWGQRRHLYVFETDVTASWTEHRLGEGQGVGVFDADALPIPIAPVARDMMCATVATGKAALQRTLHLLHATTHRCVVGINYPPRAHQQNHILAII